MTLTYRKKGHSYIFQFPKSRSDDLLKCIADMAEDEECPLDWFDAAKLAYVVGYGVVEDEDTHLLQSD